MSAIVKLTEEEVMTRHYSEGVCEDGAAILCNGQQLKVTEILQRLKEHELARQLSSDSPELNMGNYDETEVSMLNEFCIEMYKILNP